MFEAPFTGEAPIVFTYEMAQMIVAALRYPEGEWNLWEKDGGLASLRTCLFPCCPAQDETEILLDQIVDVKIDRSNAGSAWRNPTFNWQDPWRMYVRMRRRADNHNRYISVEHLGPRQISITDTREWFGPVDVVRPGWLWVNSERVWMGKTGRTGVLGGLTNIFTRREAGKLGWELGPHKVKVRKGNDSEVYVWEDEQTKTPVAWTGELRGNGVETRSLEGEELLGWQKAMAIKWGGVDMSLHNLVELGELRG